MKYQPVSDERLVVTNKSYPAPVRIILDPGVITEVIGTDSCPTDFENLNELITRYNYYARCKAGSDNCSNAGRNCGRRNSLSTNGGRPSWSGSAQPVRSGCPCRSEESRRLDRPADLFNGSSLAMSNRPAPSPARTSRNRRDTYEIQPPPCGDQNARRGTYDVEPEPQNNRRGTYNVSQPCAAIQQNDRRGTYDVSQPCAAIQQNDRRGTYDVSQPCAAVQRNTCSNAQQQPPRESSCRSSGGSTFTMTGTFQLLGGEFQGLSPVGQQPRARVSSCSRLHDTHDDIDDYLDNHLDYDMVAPRGVALPGQPYVRIDESDANTTPEMWRLALDNRSSVASQGLGIPSPTAFDDFSSSRDTSGRRQWPSADRQSMPFGLNDSFAMSRESAPRSRQSRARSTAPECGSLSRSNRRRDTFDRSTR